MSKALGSRRGTPRRSLILFDSQCGFCMWIVRVFLRLAGSDRLAAAAIQDNRALLGDMDDATALDSFHLVDPDGAVRSAGAALSAVLGELRFIGPVGRVLGRMPRVSDRLYFAVARRRATLARLVPESAKTRARVALLDDSGATADDAVVVPAPSVDDIQPPMAPIAGPVSQLLVDERPPSVDRSDAPPPRPPAAGAGTNADTAEPAPAPAARPSAGTEADPHDPTLRTSLRLVGQQLRPNRTQLVVALLLLVAASLVGLAQPLATQWVLEALGTGDSLRNAVVILVASVLGASLAQGGGQFLMLRIAEDVVEGTRRLMVRRILGMSIAALHRREPGELMSRVVSDSASVRQIALQSVVQTVSGTVIVLGSIAMMIYLDLVLFLVTFAVILLLSVALIFIMPRIRRAAHATQRSIGSVSNEMERALGTFTTVKAAGAEGVEIEELDDRVHRARNSGVRGAGWTALAGMTSALTVQAAFLVVLGVGGLRAQSGALSVPTLVAFLLYAMQLSQPVLQLTAAISSLQAGRAALERIAETETFEQESAFRAEGIDPEAIPGGAAGDKGAGEPVPAVQLDGVWFTYPGSAEPTLRGVDLTVPPTGLTALVGPSGSGKSTVLRLIEGFYVIERGRIRVSNTVLGDWDLDKLRQHVALVEQEAPVLSGTVEDNLTYGIEPGVVKQRQIWSVVNRVGLGRRVESLDDPIHHRGNDLSGGERQRISIARALLRRPKLLLLDEVTSQLDTRTEAVMRDLIGEIAASFPVVVVAHRLSTVVGADLIVVMQDGRVRARGTHYELLETDDLYRTMVEEQDFEVVAAH